MSDILSIIDHIGNTGKTSAHYVAKFTPYTAGSIADGAAMTSLVTIPNAFRYNGGTSKLQSVTLVASDTGAGSVQTKDIQIWLFGTQGQTATAGSAFTMNYTNVDSYNLLGVISIDSAEYIQADDVAVVKKTVEIECKNYDYPESQAIYAVFMYKDSVGITYASTARYHCTFVFEHN